MTNDTISPRKGPGLFANGVWYCKFAPLHQIVQIAHPRNSGDCDPPLPATSFETKKQGRNFGRWFYTCQRPQSARCGFFLWKDDAQAREAVSLFSGSRPEHIPRRSVESPRATSAVSPPPAYSIFDDSQGEPAQPTWNRNIEAAQEQGFKRADSWRLSADEENDLIEVAKQVDTPRALQQKRHDNSTLETPTKATHSGTLNGSRKRPRSNSPLSQSDMAPSPSLDQTSKRLFLHRNTDTSQMTDISLPLLSPVTTTPRGFKDMSPELEDDHKLEEEVLGVIDMEGRISDDTRTKIKDICHRYTLRTQGIAKG